MSETLRVANAVSERLSDDVVVELDNRTTALEPDSLVDRDLSALGGELPDPSLVEAPVTVATRGHWNIIRPALVLGADAIGLMLPALFVDDGRFWLLMMAAFSIVAFQSGGLYRSRLHLSVLDEAPTLIIRMMASALLVAGIVSVAGPQDVLRTYLNLAACAIVSQLLWRTLAYKIVRLGRAKGAVGHPTLVLGGGQVAQQIISTLENNPQYGLRSVGFLDDDPMFAKLAGGVPHLGDMSKLPEMLTSMHVNALIVAFGTVPESRMVDILRGSEREGCEVFIVPRLFEVHTQKTMADHIGAIPVIRLQRPRLEGKSWAIKRLFDMTVAGLAIAALSPLMLLVALAVRLEGGPGVIFRQERIGKDGRPFQLLKFRSLKPVDAVESATNWNVSNDHRLGKVGKILRKTSIDELPQLWNILRGDMTIVGPRPERPHFVERFGNEHVRYHHRHRVPAGLTGLAQVNGLRGDTSIADRARYDNFYIENWSLWLDLKIIVATIREVTGARGG